MKNMRRFVAKSAIVLLLVTSLMPGFTGPFLSNLMPEVKAVLPFEADLSTAHPGEDQTGVDVGTPGLLIEFTDHVHTSEIEPNHDSGDGSGTGGNIFLCVTDNYLTGHPAAGTYCTSAGTYVDVGNVTLTDQGGFDDMEVGITGGPLAPNTWYTIILTDMRRASVYEDIAPEVRWAFQTGDAPVCGNDTADGGNPVDGSGFGEPCDGTDLRSYACETLPDAGFIGGTLSCQANCMAFDTSECTAPTVCDPACGEIEMCVDDGHGGGMCIVPDVCGNNYLEPGNNEQCDDGNNTNGDGCSSTCTIEIPTYHWDADAWSECSEPCDAGIQIRTVVCKDELDQIVADENCEIGEKPAEIQPCFIQACAVCGNGTLEDGEECDDGNTDDGDGCSSFCTDEIPLCEPACEEPQICVFDQGQPVCFMPNVCGNGVIEEANSEECDDNNNNDGDGCDSSCIIETAGCFLFDTMEACHDDTDEYACVWDNSACRNVTGCIELTGAAQAACTNELDALACDWLLFCGGAEGCDLITNQITCESTQDCGWGAGAGCRDAWTPVVVDGSFCILTVGACGIAEACFETEQNVYECQESGPLCEPACSEGEICVGGGEGGYVCQPAGGGCELAETCSGQIGPCGGALGYSDDGIHCYSDASCQNMCQGPLTCGNGAVDGENPVVGGGMGEPCDASAVNPLRGYTCATLPEANFSGGTLACQPSCTSFDVSACTGGSATCGNGIIEFLNGEQCDGANLNSKACTDFGFDSGTLACNGFCGFDFSQCAGSGSVCGNGVLEPGESCDDHNMLNGDGCSAFCQFEQGAGDDCFIISDIQMCDEHPMCYWDWMMGQGGMCTPQMISPCNNYPDQTTCENDNMCFWDEFFFDFETQEYGKCIENFGFGYPNPADEIYTFPQPFNNSNHPLTDGDPYSLGNRPGMMMEGVPRMWSEDMAPFVFGFTGDHGISAGQEATYLKLYRYDDLTGQWTDRTGNLTFVQAGGGITMNTEDENWFTRFVAAIRDFFVQPAYAQMVGSQILALTINPLAENTTFRAVVKGVPGFAGQTSACPDGSGNLCFTTTFRTGDSLVPTGDYQGGGADYADNYGDLGCQDGDTVEAMWPYEGATDVDPNTVVSLQVCDPEIDLTEADAVFYELDGSCTAGVNCYSIMGSLFINESNVIVDHPIPLTPGMEWMLDLDGGSYQFNFVTGDFSQTEGSPTFGAGRITVNLVDGAVGGDSVNAVGDGARVVVACGDLTMPEMDPENPGPMQPEGNAFFMDGFIPGGSNSVIINGLPTPSLGEDFDNPCLVFLSPDTSGMALGGQYYYTGGSDGPQGPTDYGVSGFNMPMPPSSHYASVDLGNTPNNTAVLNLEAELLTSGTLGGKVCLDNIADQDCGAGDTYLQNVEVNLFSMGPAAPGSQNWMSATTDAQGDFSFADVSGGTYMIEVWGDPASGQNFNYFNTVPVNGNTTHNIAISLGNILYLTLDDTAGCWNQGNVHYDFWPETWGFDTHPVWGNAVFGDFDDNGNGTYSLEVQGFGDGSYNGVIEVPGCKTVNDAQFTFASSANYTATLDGGVTITGKIVTDASDPDNTGVANLPFEAHTSFDQSTMGDFGAFATSKTTAGGAFAMNGLDEGGWMMEVFGADTQYSFVPGQGDFPASGILAVPAEGLTDIILVVKQDKRVNITVNDGVNLVKDAMIDIDCNSGKMVHLGHSNAVWTYLPQSDTCTFHVNAWKGNYQPLSQEVSITTGLTAQNVTLTLSSFNRNTGVYGGTLKADKITSFPGGKIGYVGHITAPAAVNLNGQTAKFNYPNTIANGNVTATTSAGSACTVNSGTVSCPISGITTSFFDVFVEITVPADYVSNDISASLLLGTTNIASVYTSVVKLTMNAPAFANTTDQITVYGQAPEKSTVSLSRIAQNGTETSMGTTVMEPGSTWYTFPDKVIGTEGIYNLKVTATTNGVVKSEKKEIIINNAQVRITNTKFTTPMGDLPRNSSTGLPTGQIFEGQAFDVTVTFSGAPTAPVTGSYVGTDYAFADVSGTGGNPANTWKKTITGGWTGFGNVTFNLRMNDGAGGTVDFGPIAETLILIDPSGYIYDTVDSNRISGATATVYQLVAGASHGTLAQGTVITSITGPDTNTDGTLSTAEEGTVSGEAVGKISGCYTVLGTLDTAKCRWATWDATPSGQVNPQITDSEGAYGWNVPQGWYRVSFSKAGAYSLSYSRDVYVPPAETTLNLNLGAYDIAAPTVVSVNPANAANNVARNSAPVITFSEPMLASTINNTNIKLLKAGSPVDISVTYNASSYTATIQRLDAPGGSPMNLAALTAFTIRVTTGVKDDTNNAIAAQYESTFTTTGVADNVAPVSTADIATGTYGATQTVTLSATDDPGDGTPVACPSCNIFYTLDGSAPTTSSSVYSAPLTISTTKTLKFFAKDAAGNAEAANTRTYTITVAVPGIPGGFSGGPITNGSSLNWSDVSGATGYKVYRSTTSGSGFTVLASPVSSLYSDLAVTAGTTYYYKVSSTNSAGESGLSAQVSVTPTAPAQQPQQETPSGGGGGGLSASITPPKDSNTLTSSVSSSVSSQISETKNYSRPIQISAHLILTDAIANQKTVELTGEGGSITLRPNTESTIALLIPESTTIQSSDKWDGKIDPPLIQSNTRISSTGGVIAGSNGKLYRERVVAVVKVGSTKDTLRFSNKITLEVPVDLADGTVVKVYSSEAGHEWIWEDTVMAEGGIIRFETDHTTYFAFEEEGDVPVLSGVSMFNDIAGHWAENYINSIYEMGIVSGKSEGVFAPDDNITRAELTKIAVKAFDLEVPASVSEKPFLDVDMNAWYAPYIQAAKESGIVEGWGDGNFAPNTPVNRAATLKIFIEAAGFEDVYENYQENYASKDDYFFVFFPDVRMGQWFSKYVAYAKDFGIVGGYEDGTFKPDNNITRAEVAKIALKVLGLK